MSDEKISNLQHGEEFGYEHEEHYREEGGPTNNYQARGGSPRYSQRMGYRPRVSNAQGGYQAGPRGYNSARSQMGYPADNPRGYGAIRPDYPHYEHHDNYHEDYEDYYHDDHEHRYPGPYGRMGRQYGYGPRYGGPMPRKSWRGWLDSDLVNSLISGPRANNFFRGVGLATVAILLAPPIARALRPLAVQAVHGVTSIVDELKGVVYEAKEDIEDIFAEGKWDDMHFDEGDRTGKEHTSGSK